MATVILGAAGLLVVYALFVLVFPNAKCPRMRKRKGKRPKPCPRCKATGIKTRRGATMVHRFFWLVLGDAWMARRRRG